MTMSVRTIGFEELDGKIDKLKTVARDEVLLAAFIAGGEPIAEAARSLVRRRSGKLHDSIGVGTELSPHQAALNPPGKGVQVYVGPGALPEAITEEFGTVHEAPHPYMRPAWDGQQGAAISEIARVTAAEVDKITRG
jgi:HK97 gp10 family phage protein